MVDKKDVIGLLEKIAVYMELQGENPFKINAYRRAAQALERDERSLDDIDDFTQLKGIGKGTGEVITEYIEKEESSTLKELEKEVPEGLIPLLKLPGLGGKSLSKIYHALNIVDAHSLEKAIDEGKVEELPGFGKKSVENIKSALEAMNTRPDRLPAAMLLPIAEKIEAYLATLEEAERFSRAGSLRRMRETIGDIDFIIATGSPAALRKKLIGMEDVKDIVAEGDTKVSVTVADEYDINVDFRMVDDSAFATTLHHFTGSKDHNVLMRQLAKTHGEKISEYGVENEETDELKTFVTEEDFFHHFSLHYIPPELRMGRDELEAFENPIPLVGNEDIRGDLHMHTTWSDGAQSIEEMAEAARRKGYHYMAVTDHSKFLQVANGLNESRLRRQREEIARLNDTFHDFHIFAGVEMDILPDGTLDFSDDFLGEMDIVIGAIHSSFGQSMEQIMYRLETALDNPHVSFIAHPTGRLIGKREGYAVDMERFMEKAKETETAIEINANPNRLDLSYEWVQHAQDKDIKIAINTDAHNYDMLHHMPYGVSTGRKGWLQAENVLNTWSLEALSNYLETNREK